MALQFYERFWRLYAVSTRSKVRITSLKEVAPGICRLRINADSHSPGTPLGAYYFINIPHIAPFEWHPFSVSNALNAEYTEFYIQNEGGFTSKLLDLASNYRKVSSLKSMEIQIEGPFGCDFSVSDYKRLVLVAGGIGITPLHSLFFTLYQRALTFQNERSRYRNVNADELVTEEDMPSIELLWMVRRADLFEIYQQSFQQFV